MPNQFDAELVYRRTESVAIHERTGAVCLVRDEFFRGRPGATAELSWFWRIVADGVRLEGWSRTEGLARAAVRRRVAKLPDRPSAGTVVDRSDAPVCGAPDRAGLVCDRERSEEGAIG